MQSKEVTDNNEVNISVAISALAMAGMIFIHYITQRHPGVDQVAADETAKRPDARSS
jgi:hypothetical protein